MKKLALASCLIAVVVFMAVPGWSVPSNSDPNLPYNYSPPIDSIVDYGDIIPASDAAETLFLANYLGTTVENLLLTHTFVKDESAAVQALALNLYDPGFAWDYAIVKVDGPNDFSYLFMDDNATLTLAGGDDLLTTPDANVAPYNMVEDTNPPGPFAISHVSFFRVPEPSTTLLLLGLGVVGLAALRRKF